MGFAAGEDGLAQLQAAVEAANGDGDAVVAKEVVLDVMVKARPWLQRRVNATNAEDLSEELQVVREKAPAAIVDGSDIITAQMKVEDGKVVGRTEFDSGLLKFVGSVTAHFAGKYLE